jgi:RecA/RadA recombinase
MNLSALDNIADVLSKATKEAEKKTGLTSVFQNRRLDATKVRSTGLLYLDYLIGGGIPSGKIIGISSDEHMGKSALLAEMTWEQLLDGGFTTYFDGEGTQDPVFLGKRGIDYQKYRGKRNKNNELNPGQRDKVWFYQPQTGEQFRQYIHSLCTAMPEFRELQKPPLLFGLDSALSIVSDAIAEKIDGNNTAMHAKMYADILPIVNSMLLRTGSSLVYTNQLREDVGAGFKGMGDTSYEPGGKALQFYRSLAIRLQKRKPKDKHDEDHPFIDGFIPDIAPKAGGLWEEGTSVAKDENKDRSIIVQFKTIKNKFYTPFKVGFYRIVFESAGDVGYGFCPVFDTFSTLHHMGLIVKANNKQTYKLNLDEQTKEIATLLPEVFDYYTLKSHILACDKRELRTALRRITLESGWAYEGVAVETSPEEDFDPLTGEIKESPKTQGNTQVGPIMPPPPAGPKKAGGILK